MNNINKIKRFAIKNKISNEELLYINFAEDIGLKLEYLDKEFQNTENNKIYKIQGLIWKYNKIAINDSYISNELYIHLEQIKIQEDKIKDNNSLKLSSTISSSLINQSPYININSQTCSITHTLNQLNAYSTLSERISTSTVPMTATLSNEISDLKDTVYKQNIKNPCLTESSEFDEYVTLTQFKNIYLLDGKQIDIPVMKQKFKIVIDN
jgi:hypothetical protein